MKKKYVSVDVEAAGLTPGKYSMLSLGACIVGDLTRQFYRELKPISRTWVMDAMRIGCLGLDCLKSTPHNGELNPKNEAFRPDLALKVLAQKGEDPEVVMHDFAGWILESTRGFKPVEVAWPIKFDGMFTAWYFDNFYSGKNPLGYGGADMNSMYKGFMGNLDADIEDLHLPDERTTPHNALEDAIQQAKEFEHVLRLMKVEF